MFLLQIMDNVCGRERIDGRRYSACSFQLRGGPASGRYPLGLTQLRYDVTDEAGNEASCEFTVTVQQDRKIPQYSPYKFPHGDAGPLISLLLSGNLFCTPPSVANGFFNCNVTSPSFVDCVLVCSNGFSAALAGDIV